VNVLSDIRLRRITALAAVNLLVVMAGWLVLVSPQRLHAASDAQKAQGVQSQIAQLSATESPAAVRKPPVIHTAPLYELAEAMPSILDEPDMLLTIDQVARAAGAHVTTLSPSTSLQGENGYTLQQVSLVVDGSYAAITQFVHALRTLVSVKNGALEASGRLFSIDSLELAPQSSGSGLVATMTLDAYVFGEVAGAAPPPVTTSTDTTETSTTSTTSG